MIDQCVFDNALCLIYKFWLCKHPVLVQGAANKSVTFSESYDDFVLSSFPSEIFSTGRVLHHLASINSSRLNFLKMSTEDIQHATIVNFLCAAPSKDKKK